jgi:uncharacterized protein YkwD
MRPPGAGPMLASVGVRVLKPVLFVALAAAALALPVSASPAGTAISHSTLDSGVLQQLNAIRVLHGLVPLQENRELDASAAQHSQEMGAKGYFEHNSANGTVFWRRIQHWYGSTDYRFWSVGENLLWSSPDVDATGALRMWMNSPEHRANILNPSWRQIGISSEHFAAAPGAYHGLQVTIITTDFGVRR